jgi:hypothetical protein
MVVSGRLSKSNIGSVSKGASSSNAASISSLVRVNASLGPVMEMSEVEVEAMGERRESRVVAELDTMGWGVAMTGSDAWVVMGVETRAFFLPFNFKSAWV